MAVMVKLNDATVSVGGDFNAALAYVKGFAGRRFDGATKMWIVPAALKDFTPIAPMDIISGQRGGQHVTRYGTRYSSQEWRLEQELHNAQAPIEAVRASAAAQDAAERALVAALGMPEATVARMKGIELRCSGDWDEAVAAGWIKFSSPERRAAVETAFEAYHTAMCAALDIETAARQDVEQAIRERYEIY